MAYVIKTGKYCLWIRKHGLEAANYIKEKYDYYKNDIASAEDFIRLSATQSTMFGNKYYIKCSGSPKMESSIWLLQELKKYRKKTIIK